MIICPNCSRENADHYKFCLGCGTELKGGGAAKAAVPAPSLGRPGRKLRLDSPLFGGKKSPGGLSGLSGLSRRLGAKPADGDDDDGEHDELDEAASSVERSLDESGDGHDSGAYDASADALDASDSIEDEGSLDDEPDFEPEIEGSDEAMPDFGALDDDDDIEERETAAGHAVASPIDHRPPTAAELGRINAVEDDDDDELEDYDDFDDLEPVAEPVSRPVAQRPAPVVARPVPIAKPAPVARPVPIAPAAQSPAAQSPIAPAAQSPAAQSPTAQSPTAQLSAAQPAAAQPVSPAPVSAPPAAQGRVCHACGAVVPQGFKFCGVCGTRYDAPQVESPAASVGGGAAAAQAVGAPSAHLVLIHPDGTEGEIFPLSAGETTVGRAHPSSIFAEDPFLSPRHATFYFVQGQLYVRDEGSLNGVFLRIRAEVELFHYDMFRIGQQLLRFEEMSQVRPIIPGSGDATTVMGSPVRGTWGRLASVVALDTVTSVWAMRKPEIFLGRERGDLVFPDDGFVSGSHCKLGVRRGRYFLGDLDSTNGTYLRIKGEGIVTRGDLLLLGQQLFKVELNR